MSGMEANGSYSLKPNPEIHQMFYFAIDCRQVTFDMFFNNCFSVNLDPKGKLASTSDIGLRVSPAN